MPILTQESFWWWQCSDRYIISLDPHLHTPLSPSLISLKVSVDVKLHVYLNNNGQLCTSPGGASILLTPSLAFRLLSSKKEGVCRNHSRLAACFDWNRRSSDDSSHRRYRRHQHRHHHHQQQQQQLHHCHRHHLHRDHTNWKPSSSHSISILTNMSTQFLLQSVCVCCAFFVCFL